MLNSAQAREDWCTNQALSAEPSAEIAPIVRIQRRRSGHGCHSARVVQLRALSRRLLATKCRRWMSDGRFSASVVRTVNMINETQSAPSSGVIKGSRSVSHASSKHSSAQEKFWISSASSRLSGSSYQALRSAASINTDSSNSVRDSVKPACRHRSTRCREYFEV